MSSASFDRPSTKLILSAIGIVVLLHVLTAIALTLVKTPTPVIEPLQETPPIEIELLTIADTISSESDSDSNNDGEANNAEVIDAEEATTEKAQAEPEAQIEPEAELEVEPQVEPEPEIEQEPIVEHQPEPEVVESKPEITEPEPEVIPPEPETIEPEAQVESAQPPATEPELKSGVTTSTTTTIERSDGNSGSGNASPSTSAPAAETYGGGYTPHSTIPTAPTVSSMPQVNRGGKSQRSIPKGRDEAPKKDAIATPPATNNEPVSFDESDASWAIPPKLSFPDRAKRGTKPGDNLTVLLTLRVNKQGGIDKVTLAQSSGNSALDREAQRQIKTGKFKPFMRDGVPVVGNVTLPIGYEVTR